MRKTLRMNRQIARAQVEYTTMVSTQLFERAQRLALALAGIELVERHRDLLENRCRRLGILDSDGFDALLIQAETGDARAEQVLLGLMTTKFTAFFRHPQHFDLAAEHALQACQRHGRATIWSAGAATGEEPWSLAMRLLEVFQYKEPPVEILATDVDSAAIDFALRGEYTESSLKAVSPERQERFFHPMNDARRFRITDSLRQLVRFQCLNLADDGWPIEGPFDVIFCRNVLMYLNADHRRKAAERMASLMAPDGILMLDPAEYMADSNQWLHPGCDGIYTLRSTKESGQRSVSTAHS